MKGSCHFCWVETTYPSHRTPTRLQTPLPSEKRQGSTDTWDRVRHRGCRLATAHWGPWNLSVCREFGTGNSTIHEALVTRTRMAVVARIRSAALDWIERWVYQDGGSLPRQLRDFHRVSTMIQKKHSPRPPQSHSRRRHSRKQDCQTCDRGLGR